MSLEDLYNGTTRQLAVQKNVICETCNGIGGKEGSVQKCEICNGTGITVRMRQIGPGMVCCMKFEKMLILFSVIMCRNIIIFPSRKSYENNLLMYT